jgi:hypothetical protein
MSKVTTLAIGGLQTDPGPFSGAPDGALVEAHNVVYERDGLIEPRGGIAMQSDAVLELASRAIQHGMQIEGESLRTWAEGAGTWIMRRGRTTTITGPTSFTKGRVHSALMKGRVLFTSENGVCEWPQASGTVAYRAGLMQPSMPWGLVTTGGSAGTWLATAQSVAYRFTIARARADGTIMESAPSAPFIVRNTSGSSGGVTLVPLPGLTYTPWDVNSTFDTLQAGDMLYVYRSPVLNAATGTPSDVMRLRAALPITAGAVQDFTDALSDTQWNGPELYTNARREGIGQARTRPAYARDVCQYGGMLMYAGAKSPMRVVVTCKAIGDISADPQQALCTKTITVTTTAGSLNLTGISAADTKYIAPGQWITLNFGASGAPGSADARFQVNTQINTVGSGSATITKTALASGAVSVTVWDWVGVVDGGTTYRQFAQEPSNTSISETLWLQAHNTSGVRMGGYADLEYKWNNASARVKDILLHATGSDEANGQPEFRNVLMVFERASMSSTTFQVISSKPNAFNRTVDHQTGITSTQDGGDARLGISVNDIPDALPEGNFIDIGDLSSPIYRVLAARSSLLVFKGDGVYQVFGTSPASLTVQLLDGTVAPPRYDIAANWMCARGDAVYMMSSRGPMLVTESGATPFGAAINETLRETFGPGFELASTFTSCAAGASPAQPYALFSYTTASESMIFVYNTQTGAWTTWSTRRPTSALWVASNGAQALGMQDVDGVYYDKRTDMGAAITGSTHPLTGDTFGAGVGTFATITPLGSGRFDVSIPASEWAPEVGDVMIQSGILSVVDTVASPASFAVVSNGTPTTGVVTWEEGYPIRLVWTARTLGTLASEKRNVTLCYGFALRALLLRMQAYFQTSYAPGGVQTTVQPQVVPGWDGSSDALLFAPELLTVGVPQDVILDWGIRVGLTLQQARAWFSLGAVTIDALDSGVRTGRGKA